MVRANAPLLGITRADGNSHLLIYRHLQNKTLVRRGCEARGGEAGGAVLDVDPDRGLRGSKGRSPASVQCV